ncbi:hypothetical protein OSB04_016355 [Centaurea solstitialis]|uniref:WAT1-related protein n=1 Tax=Centaurea solstitialis TaxID=347529 RepID=A0AA38TCN5_9ASTR|nr:hypothetical protein OSB04_016355 [Centaurea solstitialis]
MGGKAKVIGTLVGLAGAMVLTFYKGHQLNIWSTHFDLLNGGQHMDGHVAATHKTSPHHIIGSLFALASSLSAALYLTLQGIASSLSVIFITASIHLQGPLFVSNFNPLMLIFVAIVGYLVLGENLHVGSILGAVIIVAGLYVTIWGKSNINRLSKQIPSTGSKDVNDDALSINDTTTTLDTTEVAHTSFSTNSEDNQLHILSTRVEQ